MTSSESLQKPLPHRSLHCPPRWTLGHQAQPGLADERCALIGAAENVEPGQLRPRAPQQGFQAQLLTGTRQAEVAHALDAIESRALSGEGEPTPPPELEHSLEHRRRPEIAELPGAFLH